MVKKEIKKKEVVPVPPKKEDVVQDIVVVAEGQPIVPQDFKSKLTREQISIIKEQYAKGASDTELQMFLYVCQSTGLDPFSKQIHLVPRWDSRLGKEVRGVITGIDGLRSIAERTGAYAGNSDPTFGVDMTITVKKTDFKTKKEVQTTHIVPCRATVTVKKIVQGVMCDFTATAEWSEYYPGDKQGMMWTKMPKNMLGKCAEAKALRKAFPAVLSGLYVGEEMHQSQALLQTAAAENPKGDFDTAVAMIKKVADPKGLEELKDKLNGSKKYDAKQKKELLAAVDARIAELKPKETTKTNAPETLPVVDADDPVGDESDEL